MPTKSSIAKAMRKRPMPSADLVDVDGSALFVPAPDLLAWVRSTIVGDGPLYNPEHDHLVDAHLGFLWTNVANGRNGKRIVGTCEIPNVQGNRWLKARVDQQLCDWFGDVPDFLITLDALFAVEADDATFCALVEHELFHASQAVDAFGEARFSQETGRPIFAMRGHDAEAFIGVTRRYGVGAAESGVAELVKVAARPPEIAQARIDAACGACK